jgi:hypothetical protein
VAQIELAETVAALRDELARAAVAAADADVQFPVGPVTVQFQVGITRSGGGKAGINFWVLGMEGTGSYDRESVHTVTVVLDPPVDAQGRRIKVGSDWERKPA